MAPKLSSPRLVPGSAPGLGTSSARLLCFPSLAQRTTSASISGAQLPLVKQNIEMLRDHIHLNARAAISVDRPLGAERFISHQRRPIVSSTARPYRLWQSTV